MGKELRETLENMVRKAVENALEDRLEELGIEPTPEQEKSRKEKNTRRVIRTLTRQGYFLEIQVYEELKKRGWDCELNCSYWDIESESRLQMRPHDVYKGDVASQDVRKTIQTIDVVATKETKPSSVDFFFSAEICLVIECKYRSSQNLAFYTVNLPSDTKEPSLGLPGEISFFWSKDMQKSFVGEGSVNHLDIPEKLRRSMNWASHQSERVLGDLAINGVTIFGGGDTLKEAVNQVMNASIFKAAFFEQFMYAKRALRLSRFKFWRLYPVIVFDGPLWSYKTNSGEPTVKPLKWVTYQIVRKDYEYNVDVVSFKHLDDYLDTMSEELEEMSKV
jgi:hypothetical protein